MTSTASSARWLIWVYYEVALWGSPRIVTYGSSQLDDLPGSFVFESRIVFCGNVIPRRNDAFKAVLSRCDIFELSASQEEVVELMRRVAMAGYETLSPDDCLEVVDFIEQHGDDRAISLRLLEPSFRKVLYARSEGLDWRPLVLTQLKALGARKTRPGESTPRLKRFAHFIKPSNDSPTL